MLHFKRSTGGQEFFCRKKRSLSVMGALMESKQTVIPLMLNDKGDGLLQVPVTITTGSCIVAPGVDLDIVDGMV
jgi:hypothetical protein